MFSLTQSGVYVTLIMFIFGIFNIDFIPQSEVETVVEGIITVIGLFMAWYGRYRKGDITALGVKK